MTAIDDLERRLLVKFGPGVEFEHIWHGRVLLARVNGRGAVSGRPDGGVWGGMRVDSTGFADTAGVDACFDRMAAYLEGT